MTYICPQSTIGHNAQKTHLSLRVDSLPTWPRFALKLFCSTEFLEMENDPVYEQWQMHHYCKLQRANNVANNRFLCWFAKTSMFLLVAKLIYQEKNCKKLQSVCNSPKIAKYMPLQKKKNVCKLSKKCKISASPKMHNVFGSKCCTYETRESGQRLSEMVIIPKNVSNTANENGSTVSIMTEEHEYYLVQCLSNSRWFKSYSSASLDKGGL